MEELPVRTFFIESVFYRVGTGVSIAPTLKLIRPTLSKMKYNMENGLGLGEPFVSV